MLTADRMTDAVLDAAVHAHSSVGEDEFAAPVRIGDSHSDATAHYYMDGNTVVLVSVSCGNLVLNEDDLSRATLDHVVHQVRRFIGATA